MGRKNAQYKIRRLPVAAAPESTPGTEASQMPTVLPPQNPVIAPSNKISTTQDIRAQIAHIMNTRNYHPIRELVEMVQAQRQSADPVTGKPCFMPDGVTPRMEFVYDAEFRRAVHAELAPYIAPKLKAIDLQVQGELNVTIQVVKFADRGKVEDLKQAERIVDI